MIKLSDLRIRVIGILILVGLSIFYVFPLDKKVNLGLDLRGGMYVLLRADTKDVKADKVADAISGAIEKIRNRIDAYGVKETSIQVQEGNSILVQVPGVVNREIVDRLKEVGRLEFKLVEEDKDKLAAAIKGTPTEDTELLENKKTPILLKKEVSVSGSDLAESMVGFDSMGLPSVKLQFTTEGAKKFAKVTEENTGKQLAIVLDGKVMSAPQIREAILSGQAEITGDFSMDEARLLTSVLNSGALPVPLIVEEERTVGPLLGSDSIRRGINSTLLGVILVAAFMLVYYFLGGLVAVVGMVLDLLFILAGLNLLHGTLTLPGIAGMILTLGMAVDANVLIYERIREELESKKPLSIAIKNGFDRSKSAIYDSNLTTIIAAVFLFIYGTGPIRGFATTLILGNVVSLFTAIFLGKTLFALFLNNGLKKLPMMKMFAATKIDFVKARNFCLIGSAVIIGVGMFSFAKRQNNIYGIDFKGGQVLEYKVTPAADIEKIRTVLAQGGLTKIDIQDVKDIEGAVLIKSKDDIATKSEEILKKNFTNVEKLKVTMVGPTVGKTLKKKALMAIIFSLLGILVYVAIRFKHFDFGLAGVIAIFHDVIVALGFASLFGYEVDLLTVTALLTIAGYSINDTIVIYDRIREVAPRMHKSSLKEIINFATNNTLSRTMITSSTVIMTVLAMYLAGGEALRGFSFVLLVGFISGVYSTVYIAAPLVLLLNRKRV